MKTRVNITFWANNRAKGSELCATSSVTIYCRINVRGKRVEHSTSLTTTYGNWVAAGGMSHVKGRTPADKHINTQLTKLRDELTDIWADLERQGKPVTARAILQLYRNGGAVLDMQALYAGFLAERQQLVGIEISQATYEVAKTRRLILTEFLAAHGLADLRPEEFNRNMADKMLYWMLKVKQYGRSYANKVLQSMSQCLRWGVRREHLGKNPMELYQFKAAAATEIKYLNVGELQALTAVAVPSACLDRVRDCFVFQCWTGLAYADLAALDVARDAEYHSDGRGNLRRVLRVQRAKSTMQKGYECVIPLLPQAELILAKYEDELPVISNVAYNRYLKELGQLCGFPADKMTTHVGRKTAGVMMLNLGIRMETVSKFLGHSSVKMTERLYAKILDTTVVDEFGRLFGAQASLPSFAPPAPVIYELSAPRQPAALTRPARRVNAPSEAAPEPEASRWRRPAPVTSHDGPKPSLGGRVAPIWGTPSWREEVAACG